MKSTFILCIAFSFICLPVVARAAAADKAAVPRIEVCFVLDTTGSMGGLIEGAKQKIWNIANEIVKAKPAPELKIGLVAYRDRGDVYVTRPFPLTDDIDTVYAHLMDFQAEGGGDEPESVNEALAVAVGKMDWSKDPSVLKMIFLVGDAPPHMNYPNDVLYPVTCKQAVKKDIIINTVQCGTLPETTPDWKKIASLGEGRYASIGETGDMAVVATPMDTELADLNTKIGTTLVPYGNAVEQQDVMEKQARSEAGFASVAAAPAASDRLFYNVATGKAVQGNNELVNDYANDPNVLKKIAPQDLPPVLQNKTIPEVEAYLKQQQATRTDLQKRVAELSQQRAQYITEQRKKISGPKDGFDDEVAKILREEAANKDLKYE
jgi:von Willebrand factor type A domain